jgi:putative heme iron utilization protein
MSDAFTPQVSDRICKHMNDDHGDAVILYATAYGHLTDVTSAQMASIDAEGMNLIAQVGGSDTPVRIPFSAPLADAKAAHKVLVEMINQTKTEAPT